LVEGFILTNLVSLPPIDSDEAAPILAAMERAIRDMAPVTPLVGAQFAYEAIRSFMPEPAEPTAESCGYCGLSAEELAAKGTCPLKNDGPILCHK
jgi:hypothetical protein